MKKNYFLRVFAMVLFLISISLNISAQSSWELVYDGQSELGLIKGIDFVPGDDNLWQNGWAAQYNGKVLKTTDGGDSWTEITQTLSTTIWGIDFVDENIGYLAGNYGKILKSEDGGETWMVVYENDDDSFHKIQFKNADEGVAVGFPNHLYTDDGGLTWTVVTADNNYWGLDYAAGDTYWAVQAFNGPVGKTEDNGQSWSVAHNTGFDLTICVDFLDSDHGIVGGGAYQVQITTDGGSNWENQTVSTGNGEILAARWFDQDTLWACGIGIHKSTDGGENWVEDTTMWDDGISNREMALTGTNVVFVSGNIIGDDMVQIWRKVGVLGATAIFEASETNICDGSSVDFTDMSVYGVNSWEWTFEGGTPATSTDQNPTVTYENGGNFDVTLTVTNSLGYSGTTTMEDYISVFETPEPPNTPTGETGICTGNTYLYTTEEVTYGEDYEWEVTPADAGTMTENGTDMTFTADDNWTGDFTIKVRATNFCNDGEWSDELLVTQSISPETFTLEGGGSYCAGGEGVEITLNGSQSGVDYELYFEGEATGNIVSGTGDALSFGNLTEAGLYEALGYNDNCETSMSEQIEVIVNELPTPEVTGLDMVCDHDVTDYETVENAGSTYNWEVSGGTIVDGQGTYMVTIEWGDAGDGTVTVTEEDENGCEATTEAFDVFIDDCTDINENGLNVFNIYPNPATNQLNVELIGEIGEDTKISVYNHLGQIVLESDLAVKEGKQTIQFDVSGLRNGIYIVKVQNSMGNVITQQIIKN